MKKATVIIGLARSGKTRKARELASVKFKANEIEELSLRGKRSVRPFFFAGCRPETKLIILDDVRSLKFFNELVFTCVTRYGIEVEIPYKAPFVISPEIIITCDEIITRKKIEDLGLSVSARINLIEIPAPLPKSTNSIVTL